MNRWYARVFTLVSLVLAARLSAAGVPNPATSSVDPCLVTCPYGDIAFHVTVRDAGSNPVAYATVQIDLCACAGWVLCPIGQLSTAGAQRVPGDTCIVTGVTGVSGAVTFHLHSGGTCAETPVVIMADGVMLATRNLASPDQNGSLAVLLDDEGIATAKLGSSDPTADFDCDGLVTAADIAFLDQHIGHGCDVVTGVEHRSWGGMKIRYR